jgi:hypothetical protein
MNRPSADELRVHPATTVAAILRREDSDLSRSIELGSLGALIPRCADERNDEAVHRVRQEQEPEDRLDLFATQARPASDRLGDGSRDAPTHAGERCIADSQGSIMDVHTERMPRTELDETCRHPGAPIVSSC